MEGASSRGVVREEAAIVPTGLLTGAGRLGQKQPVVDVGGEQRVGLLVAGAAGPCRRRRQPAVPRWRSGRNNISRVEASLVRRRRRPARSR
jgi:hypothetical protein